MLLFSYFATHGNNNQGAGIIYVFVNENAFMHAYRVSKYISCSLETQDLSFPQKINEINGFAVVIIILTNNYVFFWRNEIKICVNIIMVHFVGVLFIIIIISTYTGQAMIRYVLEPWFRYWYVGLMPALKHTK